METMKVEAVYPMTYEAFSGAKHLRLFHFAKFKRRGSGIKANSDPVGCGAIDLDA